MGVLSTDGQATRPRVGNTGPIVSRPKAGQHTISATHEWPDTESVDEEIDVNSGDLQGFERSELEALSPGTHTGKRGNGIVGGS